MRTLTFSEIHEVSAGKIDIRRSQDGKIVNISVDAIDMVLMALPVLLFVYCI